MMIIKIKDFLKKEKRTANLPIPNKSHSPWKKVKQSNLNWSIWDYDLDRCGDSDVFLVKSLFTI